jgi:tetratricopeptide (TPR) repeat protein
MTDNRFEKFEAYVQGLMSPDERSLFEAALTSDEELALDFQVYRSIETEMRAQERNRHQESALRQTLQNLNGHYFKTEPPPPQLKVIPLFRSQVYRISAAIAAGLVILLVAYFFLYLPTQNTQTLANTYYQQHLQQLSQTMDGENDPLQAGIAAYNNQDYKQALQYFQAVHRRQPNNPEAQKNIGLVYLATKEYGPALQQFESLAARKDLFSNPGRFLQALTLMQRNGEGDKQQAQVLLQQVVREKAEGSRQAAEWLQKFK